MARFFGILSHLGDLFVSELGSTANIGGYELREDGSIELREDAGSWADSWSSSWGISWGFISGGFELRE